MAHHKSAKKRIRQAAKRRIQNRYYGKTARNAIRGLRESTSKSEATEKLPKIISMIDKLVKMNIIHKRNAANKKSKLMRFVSGL